MARRKYSRHLHKTNTIVLTIDSPVMGTKSQLSSAINAGLGLFVHAIYF